MVTKVITSTQHPIVKKLWKLRKDRRFRKGEKQVLLYGETMVREWFPTKKVALLLTEKKSTFSRPYEEKYILSKEALKKIAGYEEKVLAVVDYPPAQDLKNKEYLLLLDGIQDASNIGSLFRSALGLGWEGFLLTSDCADLFHERSIRASKGAVFQLPYQVVSLEKLSLHQKKVIIAHQKGEDIRTFSWRGPMVLVLGNEGHGPRKQYFSSYSLVSLPMSASLQSYNVAICGAILMYHWRCL